MDDDSATICVRIRDSISSSHPRRPQADRRQSRQQGQVGQGRYSFIMAAFLLLTCVMLSTTTTTTRAFTIPSSARHSIHEACGGQRPRPSLEHDGVSSATVRCKSYRHCVSMGMFHGGERAGTDGVHPNARQKWSRSPAKFGRQMMKEFFFKARTKLDLIIRHHKKNQRNVLAAAAIFFAATLTILGTVDQTHHRPTAKPETTNMVLTSKATSVAPPPFSAGGSSIFSASSSQAMKNIAFVPPGGGGKSDTVENTLEEGLVSTSKTFRSALEDLGKYMEGPKSDSLVLLASTALVPPLCKMIGTSPIIGFLAAGMILGPNALGVISGVHTTETFAELGIVFFLFEMGLELSFDRLRSMKKDVFGLGLCQFITTALAVAGVGHFFDLPANALVVLGGGLALSSSAFVLQLLKDKNQLATRFGKASFGVLLFQDLAVVPLLVATPILAGGGKGLAQALGSAVIKAAMALGSIAFAGRVVLNPLFKTVAGAQSQEAFLGVILLTVLSMSFMTEGLGLSNTLGAFLAGVLLSETKYRYQVEADIAPFRGILLGLFFVTVGFEIDLKLIASNLPSVGAIVAGTVLLKTTVTTLLSLAFGLSLSTSQQTGLILSQGGEFAFVAFGLARNLGILDSATTKLMLTSVALTMAVTPFLSVIGSKIAKKIEEGSDFTHYLGQDRDANEIKESDDFVVVVGYGVVGKVVCDLLDLKFIQYVGLEIDPNKAIQARNQGLPVFYGDIGRPEVADAFNVGDAKAVIVTIADKADANRAVISLRRQYPTMKIFARASDPDHAERLQRTLDVIAMVPVVPEDNILLTLPFGGAVLRSLGAPPEEVNAILEGKRKELLQGRGMADVEESMFLAQLGIPTTPIPKVFPVKTDGSKDDKDDDDDDDSPTAKAVAAALEEKKLKNPMVADVIEAGVGISNKASAAKKKKKPESIEDHKESEVNV